MISGVGEAIAALHGKKKRTIALKEGDMLVIAKRERHQIRNTGRYPLRTLNLYVPPAYSPEGEVKDNAK